MLMLVIGVLIGMMGIMVWKTRSVSEGEHASNTTSSGAPTGEVQLATTSTTALSQARGLPAVPSIPKNTRMGLSVTDQFRGNTVSASALALTDNKWVAVYDERDGHPGWILGAARAHTGESSVVVPLLRPTEVGKTYYVAILDDDGDDVFNRLADLPPLTPEKVVVVSFVVN